LKKVEVVPPRRGHPLHENILAEEARLFFFLE